MDVDFWAARVHSSKLISAAAHQSSKLNSSGNYTATAEDEASDEVRAYFRCPYCYVEIELQLLCDHLQEEHCFDLKNAVCPICAANLGKDALGHFSVQHAHSVKRRKKSQKSGFWSNISADIVRDFRELSSFLGGNGNNNNNNNNNNSVTGQGRVNSTDPSPDPLLLPFISAVPNENQKDVSLSRIAETDDDDDDDDDAESKPSLLDEDEEHNSEEKKQRAEFLQDLILSTIF